MSIAQTVYDICELARSTKKPFLLVSNPGAGKTTGVRQYAEKNGYHLEVVIGSRSTPEELLGYQVNNGGESLEHLDSQWWHRIIEFKKKGIPSILFCDEISTCPGQTEGAMLSLIQDRENQKGEKLPDDCIVLGAANYSKNLPSYMDIITPAVNRFCVINLMDGMTGLDLVSELFHPEINEAKQRSFSAFSDKEQESYNKTMEKFFSNLFIDYADKKSSKGFIDICNPNIAGLYQDAEKGLYNVISLRSMTELTEILQKALEFGMNDKGFLHKIMDGMIGAGSNSFTDDKQGEAFRKTLHNSADAIAKQFMKKSASSKTKANNFNYGEKNIANIVEKMNMSSQEINGNFIESEDDTKQVDTLLEAIDDQYGDIGKTVIGMNDNVERQAAFISDYEAVGEFFDLNEKNLSSDAALHVARYLSLYSAYYAQLGKGKTLSDVNRMKVFKNYKSSLYMCSLIAVKDQMVPAKYDEAFVKDGDMIEIGVRRISERTPYKIPYNSSVSTNQLGQPAPEYFPLVFENGKLIAINSLDLAAA